MNKQNDDGDGWGCTLVILAVILMWCVWMVCETVRDVSRPAETRQEKAP